MTTGPVHFIHLGGEWLWQHWRAVETGRRMQGFETNTIIHSVEPDTEFGFYPHHVEVRPLETPRWLLDHPIQLANVKDLIAYLLLYDEGGIYLDLDTISLRPAWDLLENDLCVSREYHPSDPHPNPYNTAAMIARPGAPVLKIAHDRAYGKLVNRERTWGAIGPHLMTDLVEDFPDRIDVAPYRALNGWSYHQIGDYYADPHDPGDEVRVIHLYSSDHPEWLEDKWMP